MTNGFSNWKWNEKGTLVSLNIDGKPALYAQGIEFSDGTKHFKHLDAPKSNAEMKMKTITIQKNKMRAAFDVYLTNTRCSLLVTHSFSSTRMKRDVELIVHEGGYFEDIALHNAFFRGSIQHAEIVGKTMPFEGNDRNHQYVTKAAKLVYPSFSLDFEYESTHPPQFDLTTYVRSTHENQWWVHGRLFPTRPSDSIIRMCRPEWDKEIPFTRWLLRIKPIKDYLWHVGERPETIGRKTFGIVALGRVYIPANTRIQLTETVTYTKRKGRK